MNLRLWSLEAVRWTIDGPDSSYSSLLIHILWKVEREARMDPPIQTEYLRSGGATILTLMEAGARAVTSLDIRSLIPGNIVVPPERTMLAYKSLRISTSHFMMVWKVLSAIPSISRPVKLGWNKTSGHRKRSLPITMMFPSGNSKDFSKADDSAAFFIYSSKSTAMKHRDSLMSRTISRSAVVVKE